MTDLAGIRNWLFKSLAVEDALDGFEEDGLAVRPDGDPRAMQRLVSLEDFSPDVRQTAMKTLPIYLSFFCLENAVRELIRERLAENHGPDWWAECASSSIASKVTNRKEKEGKRRWHAKRGEHEIYYTDFGDLAAIIQGNWQDFEDLFPDQNWVVSRLGELEQSRNIIAHSNELDRREMDRIKLYVEDWTRQVG